MLKGVTTVAVLSTLALSARLAAADDAPPEPAKDPTTAVALSVGGTAFSIGLSLSGLALHNGALFGAGAVSSLITPSAGEMYAGQTLTWGLGLRVLSTGVAIAGVSEALKCFSIDFSSGSNTPPCHDDPGLASALLIGGAIGYGAGIVYDIATAGSAAHRYNDRHHLQLTPVVARSTSGSAMGLGLSGAF